MTDKEIAEMGIRPVSLAQLCVTCENSKWLGDVMRALGGQDVKLDCGQRATLEIVRRDCADFAAKNAEKKEKWRERQSQFRKRKADKDGGSCELDDDKPVDNSECHAMSRDVTLTRRDTKNVTQEKCDTKNVTVTEHDVTHHSLTHSPTHPLTHSPTHSLTHTVNVTVNGKGCGENGDGNGSHELSTGETSSDGNGDGEPIEMPKPVGGFTLNDLARQLHAFAAEMKADPEGGPIFDERWTPQLVCMAFTGDWKSRARWGQLAAAIPGDQIREEVFAMYREIRSGEEPKNRAAALNARLTKLMAVRNGADGKGAR